MPRPLRIGVNAPYLIPGGVGGTEIYLRNLLSALAAIDRRNIYYVFTNRETGGDLSPAAENFHTVGGIVPARVRPLRLLCHCLLEAVFSLLRLTLYYARLSKVLI